MSAAHLTDGRGVLGVGRTLDDAPTGWGSHCRTCGVHNGSDAKYCDGCGPGLA